MINQPSRNQQGFIIPIIVAVVVIVLAAGGAWYYLSHKTGDANPLSALQKTTAGLYLNPNCDYKDADLCKFLNNWPKQQNYTMAITSTDKDGAKSTGTFQIDGQTKTHLIMSGNDQSYNTITIDNTTYTKDPSDNKWWKQTITTDNTSSQDNFKFEVPSATASAEERTTFTKEGKEACGNLTCFKYHSMTGNSMDSMEEVWFDDSQYLLRKIESMSTDGSKSTIEYSYDKVSISAPSPIKEATANQTIMPNGTTMDSGMTQEQLDQLKQMSQQMMDQMGQ